MTQYLCMAGAVAAADCIIKSEIKNPPVKNRGFALNRFEDHQKFVTVSSVLMTGAVAAALVLAPEKDRTGIALILGGAVSNTADRIFRKYVVDYIPVGKVVFNLSDFAIIAGALITAYQELKD